MIERYSVETREGGHKHPALVAHDARARVVFAPERGGMITRFTIGTEEVFFLDESTLRDPTKNVRGGVPILFPIAGRLTDDTLKIEGKSYPMKQHGFARNLPWKVAAAEANDAYARLVLELESSDDTRGHYPFEFLLRYTYTLRGTALDVTQRFENKGARPMPIQPGLHPYFEVDDGDKQDALVITDAKHAFDNVTKRAVELSGPIDLKQKEVDLHLLDHRARGTTLVRPKALDVRLEFSDDQSVLVVWTLAGKNFVCVEPWSAPANALNEGKGIVVAPHDAHESWLTITVDE